MGEHLAGQLGLGDYFQARFRLMADCGPQIPKREARDAWPPLTFRATGITTFLENGGDLETAQRVAGHASTGTTRIYDYREQQVAQEEIERVRI